MTQINQPTSSGFFGTLYQIVTFTLRYWYLIIGFFTLTMVIIIGIKDSYQKSNIGEFIVQVGGRIMSPDSIISFEVDKLKMNPKITVEGNREYSSYWDKLKFKFGKWGSHIRILTSLIFLIGMFWLFYQGLNLLSERKSINLVLAFLVMVLLQSSFMLMTLYKDKVGVYPSMSQFIHTYSSILYLVVTLVIVGITFAIFNSFESSQIMINVFYTMIIGSLIFIFIGYLGVVNSLDKTLEKKDIPTNADVLKSVIPFKGTYSLLTNWRIVLGTSFIEVIKKIPEVNESIGKSVNV